MSHPEDSSSTRALIPMARVARRFDSSSSLLHGNPCAELDAVFDLTSRDAGVTFATGVGACSREVCSQASADGLHT